MTSPRVRARRFRGASPSLAPCSSYRDAAGIFPSSRAYRPTTPTDRKKTTRLRDGQRRTPGLRHWQRERGRTWDAHQSCFCRSDRRCVCATSRQRGGDQFACVADYVEAVHVEAQVCSSHSLCRLVWSSGELMPGVAPAFASPSG